MRACVAAGLRRLLAPVIMGIAPLASPSTGFGQIVVPKLVETPSPEQVVRLSYESLQDALRQSGTEFQYQLTNIRTIPASDFHKFRVQELLTVVPRKRLQILRSETSSPDGHPLAITFEAHWYELESRDEDPNRYWNPTIEEAVEDARKAGYYRPEDQFVAVTAYDVRVDCLGQSSEYRAYFIWLRLPSAAGGLFTPNDPVVDRVGETLAETLPIRTRAEINELVRREFDRLEDQSIGFNQPESPESCVVDNRVYLYPSANALGDERHATGNHRVFAAMSYQCSCDQLCVSRNSPSWINKYCYDTGQVSGIGVGHYPRTSEFFHPGEKQNAVLETGARADANYACFVQECPAGVGCGTSYTIDLAPLDIGFKFTFQGAGLVWDGQLAFTPECGPCTREQPLALHGGQPGRGPFHRVDNPDGGGSWIPGAGGCFLAVFHCQPMQIAPSACNGQSPCFAESCQSICIE